MKKIFNLNSLLKLNILFNMTNKTKNNKQQTKKKKIKKRNNF